MVDDLISRQSAIDAVIKRDANCGIDSAEVLRALPSADHLTDEELETIRIHMNAFKEMLCNQRRWREAEEYQLIVDKLVRMMEVEHED